MEIPILNKEYNCYDDGKITTSRLYTVTIKEILDFSNIDKKTLNSWTKQARECHWLYKPETDVFIKTTNEFDREEIFVRTLDDGWFSIGGFLDSGRLDVDGSLTNLLNEY